MDKQDRLVCHLGAEVLRRQKNFTLVFLDGEEKLCRLLELGQDHLHVAVADGELLIPKHAVKCYVVGEDTKQQAASKEKEEPSRLDLSAIVVPDSYRKTPPAEEKVEDRIAYYRKHGTIDEPVTVRKTNKGWLLTDGYTRYLAAERLDLGEVEVKLKVGGASAGTVQTIVRDRNFGFIVPEGGGEKIFFHRSALEGINFEELLEGDALAFEVEETEKGPQATLVRRPGEGP